MTKTATESVGRIVREFRYGAVPVFETPFDGDSGTVISIVALKPIVVVHAATITKTIIPYLGARYRRFLKEGNPQIDLSLSISSAKNPSTTIYSWKVQQVKPIYFHPSTRENRPVFLNYPLQGNG
jgi:hypothetical protein